jgi:hypothetical protein
MENLTFRRLVHAARVVWGAGRGTRAGHVASAFGLVLMLAAGLALADPDAAGEREIEHLLDYVAASHCTFMRNGADYPAAQARDHLAMKYRFTRGRIHTADEFIQYLATQSSVSGEPYKIACAGHQEPAGAWLANELHRYRSTTQAAQR